MDLKKRKRDPTSDLDPNIWGYLHRDILQVIGGFLDGREAFRFFNLTRTLRRVLIRFHLRRIVRGIAREIRFRFRWEYAPTTADWFLKLNYRRETITTFIDRIPPSGSEYNRICRQSTTWILTRATKNLFRSSIGNNELYQELARRISRYAPHLLGITSYWHYVPILISYREEREKLKEFLDPERIEYYLSYLCLKSFNQPGMRLDHPLIRRCRRIQPKEGKTVITVDIFDLRRDDIIYFRGAHWTFGVRLSGIRYYYRMILSILHQELEIEQLV